MSIEDFNNDSPWEEFAEADLLDLVEGAMTPQRAKELADILKSRHPKLLGKLTRMQADRMALSSSELLPTPKNLVGNALSQRSVPNVLDRHFQEAVEPTKMMERAVRDLGRRRRRRRQAPFIAAIAAGIAGIGVTTGIMVLIDATSPSRSLNDVKSTIAQVQSPDAAQSAPLASAEFSEAIVAEYGLVIRGVDEGAFGGQLANLLAYGDTVVVENLALDDQVRDRTGGNDVLRAAIQAGNKAIVSTSEMLPPPLVGSQEQAPSASIRLDLAERGFQYAIVIDRAKAADAVAQIGRLADSVGLVPAHLEPNQSAFVFDAWQAWQSRAAASASGEGPQQRLIVPISCSAAQGQR